MRLDPLNTGVAMELDHLFVFVESGGAALRSELASLGLTESYTRAHPGQGTANVAYVFDNAFLELLWLTSAEEASSPPIRRTRLLERSRWAHQGTCPFGIAWRGPSSLDVWPYRPPYLPQGMAIEVATLSDDPNQPMLFRSPGKDAPLDWPPERQRGRQTAAGFDTLSVELHPPGGLHPVLQGLEVPSLDFGSQRPSWAATVRFGERELLLPR